MIIINDDESDKYEEYNNTTTRKKTRPKRDNDGTLILDCMTADQENETHSRCKNKRLRTRFDTDSIRLKVDNCAIASMLPCIGDFIDAPIKCKNVRIKGFTATSSEVYTGTIQWKIEDDNGRKHTITLPRSYSTPQGNQRLLCPHHWAQVAKDNHPKRRGTWSSMYDDCIKMHWQQRKFKRTVELDPVTNTGTIYASPGYKQYHAFCAEVEDKGVIDHHPICCAASVYEDPAIIFDDNDDDGDSTYSTYSRNKSHDNDDQTAITTASTDDEATQGTETSNETDPTTRPINLI
jgi:hypothetical protein